jgi:DNA-binding transcriptional MerR regulator
MEVERFTLRQLAHRSGVTPRTVHFYVQQGLLRPAGSPGPGAKYGDGHLARLRLIRYLQREHLPLAEIRKRLDTMDDEAIRTTVAELTTNRPPEPASALDYVRGLLARDQTAVATRIGRLASSPAAPSASQAGMPVGRSAPPAALELAHQELRAVCPSRGGRATTWRSQRRRSTGAAERSQWERYLLAPDVELHVRRPLSRDQNRRVERLLALAHTILDEGLP